MRQIILLKTYQRSVLTGLVFTGIIIIYLVLFIYPSEQTRGKLDREIRELSQRAREQTALAPILIKLLKQSEVKIPTGLPFPKKQRINRADIGKIPRVVQEIAQLSHLKLKGFEMDLKSLENESGSLEIRIILNGRLSDFQKFLRHLYEVPYVKDIERLIIQTVKGEREPEFELNVSLARV